MISRTNSYHDNDLRQKSDRVYDTFKATGDQLDSDWDQMSDCLDRVKSQFDNIRGTISEHLTS